MEQSTCADQFQEQVVEKYSEMVYRLAFSQLRSKTDADDVYQGSVLPLFSQAALFSIGGTPEGLAFTGNHELLQKLWASSWRRKIVFWEEGGRRRSLFRIRK